MELRQGFGYDIHTLIQEEGSHLLLAQVPIEGSIHVLAHSDGDIVLHALSNAILSGLGKEDIGVYFPDNSQKTKDMNSVKILSFALEEMKKEGYHLNNVVVDILLQEPKLKPYREKIKESLANLLSLDKSRIGLSANTGEKVGVVGKKEAIIVYATVLMIKE